MAPWANGAPGSSAPTRDLARAAPRGPGSLTVTSSCSCSAKDYLVKPFAFAELLAWLRALARRAPGRPEAVFKSEIEAHRETRIVAPTFGRKSFAPQPVAR